MLNPIEAKKKKEYMYTGLRIKNLIILVKKKNKMKVVKSNKIILYSIKLNQSNFNCQKDILFFLN